MNAVIAPAGVYSLYGLSVRSDLPLPIQPSPPVGDADDAGVWTFRVAAPAGLREFNGPSVAEIRCAHGSVFAARYVAADGYWLHNPSTATFHIVPERRCVDVYRDGSADDRLIGLLLVGQVAVFLLHTFGCPTLHASAVVTDQAPIAFVGPPGRGKSTLAATFLERGAALLSDDCLPLRRRDDAVYGGPSLPILKVWDDTAAHSLSISHELPALLPAMNKRLLAVEGRYEFVETPTRLSAIYALERYQPLVGDAADVTITPASARDSLAMLLGQTAQGGLLRQTEIARLLPLYTHLVAQAPVRVLRYPAGFEYQDEVYARVLADLDARR